MSICIVPQVQVRTGTTLASWRAHVGDGGRSHLHVIVLGGFGRSVGIVGHVLRKNGHGS